MVGAEHLHEMHVGAGWEGRVMLEQRAEPFQIDLLHHRHRNHHMGIAHTGGRHGEPFAIHLQISLGETGGADLQRGGHLLGLQKRRPHVHPHRAIQQQFGNDPTGQGVDLPGATGAIPIQIRQEAGQATDAIAAHLRLAAIGVEDPHPPFPPGMGGEGQDHAIAADTEAAITQLGHPLRSQAKGLLGLRGSAGIQKQKVVAQTLVFAEREVAEHGSARQPAHRLEIEADPMGSSSERHPPGFDPSQPGIRLLQQWIRRQMAIQVDLAGGGQLSGFPVWVDADFLAVQVDGVGEPVLVNRRAIALIQSQT